MKNETILSRLTETGKLERKKEQNGFWLTRDELYFCNFAPEKNVPLVAKVTLNLLHVNGKFMRRVNKLACEFFKNTYCIDYAWQCKFLLEGYIFAVVQSVSNSDRQGNRNPYCETQNNDAISDDQVVHDPVNYHHVILAGVFVVFGISVLLGELETLLVQ